MSDPKDTKPNLDDLTDALLRNAGVEVGNALQGLKKGAKAALVGGALKAAKPAADAIDMGIDAVTAALFGDDKDKR